MPPHHLPTQSDFPPSLTLSITPSPSPSPSSQSTTETRTPPNILLLLHGIGDTAANFTSFARALNLPETTIVTLQAPTPLPFDLPGYHWGDDVTFDSATGDLDMDAGFARATRVLVCDVIREVLVKKCGYALREIMIFGLGQGGMLGLVCARELSSSSPLGSSTGMATATGNGTGNGTSELAGVISIGAPYPLSGSTVKGGNRTPVLLVAGRESRAVSEGAVRRTKDVFEFVEVERYKRRGDGMPQNRDEMLPIMRLFARRLRSWQGVPAGSVEIA